MEIYTIGFTQKTAHEFFTRLKEARIERLLDVRLNNTSQLAAFAKRDDLEYFLMELCGAKYEHEPLLCPTPELFKAYKRENGPWESFEKGYRDLIVERRIDKALDRRSFKAPTVLLCSEHEADFCHRRLVVEYLKEKWGGLKIVHL
jgi:uncharacterized protein (DUF488 family)